MNRTRRFLSGVTLGLVYQALVTIAGLWLTPFLLSRLGGHDYGLWLVAGQIMLYLMLVDFGVVALLPRETAVAQGRADNAELQRVIGETAWLALWQAPVVALGAFGLWLFMPNGWEDLRGPLSFMLVAFMITFPMRIFYAVLYGLQDLTFLGMAQISSWVVGTAVGVWLVFAGIGLYGLAFGWIITHAISALLCLMRLRTRFPGVWPSRLPNQNPGFLEKPGFYKLRMRLSRSVWVGIAQTAQVLLQCADIVIIGHVFGPAAVVPYVCTGKLIAVLTHQPQMLLQSAGPALSELKASRQNERLFQVCSALTSALLIASGGAVCIVVAVNQGFVSWWVGAEQYAGFWLTLFFLGNMLLRHWNLTASGALFCFGYERRASLTALTDGIVTFGATVGLSWLLGPVGAPLGAILGVSFISLPANFTGLAREIRIPIRTLLMSAWPWFIRFLLLAGSAILLSRTWVPGTFMALSAATILVVLIYVAVMLPVALQSPLGPYMAPLFMWKVAREGEQAVSRQAV